VAAGCAAESFEEVIKYCFPFLLTGLVFGILVWFFFSIQLLQLVCILTFLLACTAAYLWEDLGVYPELSQLHVSC